MLPSSLQELIDQLGMLPGVGPRTAERYAFSLYKSNQEKSSQLAASIKNLKSQIKTCPQTFMLIDVNQTISPLYEDSKRDKQLVAVVEEALDVVALEKTGYFKGTYHVLGGALSPIDGVGPEDLNIKPLIDRIATDNVKELIMATNASVEGESTALFVQKQLDGIKLKITRLARGLPAGVDLEYADQMTLTRALEERQAV